MNHITSIEQLAEALDTADPLEQSKIMKRIQISANKLIPFNTWTNECYTRNCVARTEKYEIILMCWEVGAKTPIHDHGGENCWVYQVDGTVEERRFKQNGKSLAITNRMILTPGKVTYMNDRMGFHSIENISNQRAMTLHIYASPIDTCQVYDDHNDCFNTKEMSYNTFKGNEVETPVLLV